MKGLKTVAVLAVAAIMTLPALGEEHKEHKKCPYELKECIKMMKAKWKETGWVGIEIEIDEASGVYTIIKVIPDSPAEAAGLLPGDVLYAVNGRVVSVCKGKTMEDARGEWKPGMAVTYTIKRDGVDHDISFTLARMPADVMAKYIGQHILEHQESEREEAP